MTPAELQRTNRSRVGGWSRPRQWHFAQDTHASGTDLGAASLGSGSYRVVASPPASGIDSEGAGSRHKAWASPARLCEPGQWLSAAAFDAQPAGGIWCVTASVRPCSEPVAGPNPASPNEVVPGGGLQTGVTQSKPAAEHSSAQLPVEGCFAGCERRRRALFAADSVRGGRGSLHPGLTSDYCCGDEEATNQKSTFRLLTLREMSS